MAHLNNTIGPPEGRIDDITFYKRNGRTIARYAHRSKSSSERTPKAMNRRARWKNVQNSWQLYRGKLRGLFEDLLPGQTDYTRYLSANLPIAQIYLTKQQAREGTRVLDHFVVSAGSLPSLATEIRGQFVVCELPGLEVNEQTTVSQFTFNLLGNTSRLQEGDELHFIQATQELRPGGECGSFSTKSWCLTLQPGDMRPLLAVLGGTADLGLRCHEGHLAAPRRDGQMVAWVLRRAGKNGCLISPQRLVGENSIAASFTSEKARYEAVYSYGPVNQIPLDNVSHPNFPAYFCNPQNEEASQESVFQVKITGAVLPQAEAGRVIGAGSYPQGNTVEISAEANPGWHFLCWSDGVLTRERQVTPQQDCSFTAIFAPES